MIRGMLKLGGILALYTSVACVGLAFVYQGTRTLIIANENKALEEALFEIFPAADSFEVLETIPQSSDASVSFDSAWQLLSKGQVQGIAIRTLTESYGGTLTSLVGVGTDKNINAVRILSNSDTPGLGANAASPTYYVDKASKTTFFDQFADKPSNSPFALGDDVVAISASTITSNAVTKSVRAAATAASNWLSKGVQN